MNKFSSAPSPDFVGVRESCADREIVHVFSFIDIGNCSAFEELLTASFSLAKDTIVDLTECPYLDSSGLRVLILAHKAIGTKLHVWVARESMPEKILGVSGIDRVLQVRSRARKTYDLRHDRAPVLRLVPPLRPEPPPDFA